MPLDAAIQKLAKWRSVFAGWQLGTRLDSDQECKAVKDHREVTILLRAEVNALTSVLIEKGVVTEAEWGAYLEREVTLLDKSYEQRFPGIESTEHGIAMDVEKIRRHGTMEGWPQ